MKLKRWLGLVISVAMAFSSVNFAVAEDVTGVATPVTEVSFSANDLTAGDITAATDLGNGFVLNANASKKVTVDANSFSYDGFDFTQRIKLGGTGNTEYRNISYTAAEAGSLIIYARSGSNDKDRALALSNGSTEIETINALAGKDAAGNTQMTKAVFTIPSAGTYYVYSKDSGINIYGGKFTTGSVEETTEVTTEVPTEATTEVPTEATTEVPTEATTEVPTEETTQAPVVEPVDANVLNASSLELKDYVQDEVVSGTIFTIKATDTKKVTVDANNKSADGLDFTQRIKLGGTGTKEYRNISFTVSSAGSLVVYAMSSAKAEDRALALASDTDVVATASALGTELTKITYNVPAAGTYYVYSEDSGINVYYAVYTPSGTEISTEAPTESSTEAPTESSTEAPTESSTEVPTESSTEAPTESSTEAPTESSTEVPTESSTEVPTESSTEVPTESSTEAPTESSTEAPTESSTEAPVEKPDYGDANNDGQLTAQDAAVVLQKVLDADYNISFENYMDVLDVNKDGVLTALDAAGILSKVLDGDYIFSAEK